MYFVECYEHETKNYEKLVYSVETSTSKKVIFLLNSLSIEKSISGGNPKNGVSVQAIRFKFLRNSNF